MPRPYTRRRALCFRERRSDLWALGVVLDEACCGRLPFEGRTGFEVSSAILRETPKPLGPPVPPGLWAIIQRCLAKEPVQRYQRAGEVQAALEAVQSAAIVSSHPVAEPAVRRTTALHNVRHIHVRRGDSLLLVGTAKGAEHGERESNRAVDLLHSGPLARVYRRLRQNRECATSRYPC